MKTPRSKPDENPSKTGFAWDKKRAFRFALIFVFSYAALTLVLSFLAAFHAKALAPVFEKGADTVFPGVSDMTEEVVKKGGVDVVRFSGNIRIKCRDKENKEQIRESRVEGDITAAALNIIPIIAFSFLLAWPDQKPAQRLKTACVLLIFLPMIQLLDMPLRFVAMSQEAMMHAAAARGLVCNNQLGFEIKSFWLKFLGNGGRQFMGVMLFFLALALSRIFTRPPKKTGTTKTRSKRKKPAPKKKR